MNRLLHDNSLNSIVARNGCGYSVFVSNTGSGVSRMVWGRRENIPETDSLAMSGKYGWYSSDFCRTAQIQLRWVISAAIAAA